jgi:hypothetical protein
MRPIFAIFLWIHLAKVPFITGLFNFGVKFEETVVIKNQPPPFPPIKDAGSLILPFFQTFSQTLWDSKKHP